MVHAPLFATHAALQVKLPFASCVHGSWLQQSADVTHVPPVAEQVALTMQRGMPSESGWQHASGLLLQTPDATPFGSQQLLATLHAVELDPVLQISPGFEQELPLEHFPNWSVLCCLLHFRPAALR